MTRNLLLISTFLLSSSFSGAEAVKFTLKFSNFCPKTITSEPVPYSIGDNSVAATLTGKLSEENPTSCTYNGKVSFQGLTGKLNPFTGRVVYNITQPSNFKNPAELTYTSRTLDYSRPSEFTMTIPDGGTGFIESGYFKVNASPHIELTASGLISGDEIVADENHIKNTANLEQTFINMDKWCVGTGNISCPSHNPPSDNVTVYGFKLAKDSLDHLETEIARVTAESKAKKK